MPNPTKPPTPPKLLPGYRGNFKTLLRAAKAGHLALVSAIRKADQKPVALVCAMQENEDKTITPIPFAVMGEAIPSRTSMTPRWYSAKRPTGRLPVSSGTDERSIAQKRKTKLMGERGNLVIDKDSNMFPAPVFFYTHWSGYRLKSILREALIRGKTRWDDPQYLSRIIFCKLVRGDTEGITGFGITTAIGDSEHKLLVVNMDRRTVRELDSANNLRAKAVQTWTFEEFIAAKFEDSK